MSLIIKKLDVKKDHRGWLVEILRPEDVGFEKFGQILLSVAHKGQIKGDHYHKRKKEWYCVVKGRGLLTVTDRKTGEKESIEMGDRNMILVQIPTGAMHRIENIGEGDLFLVAYLDESFDPRDPDVYTDTPIFNEKK